MFVKTLPELCRGWWHHSCDRWAFKFKFVIDVKDAGNPWYVILTLTFHNIFPDNNNLKGYFKQSHISNRMKFHSKYMLTYSILTMGSKPASLSFSPSLFPYLWLIPPPDKVRGPGWWWRASWSPFCAVLSLLTKNKPVTLKRRNRRKDSLRLSDTGSPASGESF